MSDRLLILIFGCIFSLTSCILLGLKIQAALIGKRNGSQKPPNGKPGRALICIENGKQIIRNTDAIVNLSKAEDAAVKAREAARKENREEHKALFGKIEELAK